VDGILFVTVIPKYLVLSVFSKDIFMLTFLD